MKAIETWYAGNRFRSRLEARWAVFLDKTEIDWDYEPQGYVVPATGKAIPYLPDFWLRSGQWAEVKGFLEMTELIRLLRIACYLTKCEYGSDMVILGDIPREESMHFPVQLHYHDRLWALPWNPFETGCPMENAHMPVEASPIWEDKLISGIPYVIPEWAEEGLYAARRARFEHGEHG
jgi:hypothetical protein